MKIRRGFGLWPRNLYGQILLVTASALLIAQTINATLLLFGARNRAVSETAAMVVSRVANQIERFEAEGTPIGELDRWSKQQVGRSGERRRRSPPVAITLGPSPILIERSDIQEEISERAQDFFRQGDIDVSSVRISTVSIKLLPAALRDAQLRRWNGGRLRDPKLPAPNNAVLLSARLPDGTWVNAAGLVRPDEGASILALLFQTLTLFIAVMIPLALVARRIADPLNKLTQRVQRVGLAEEVDVLELAGPDDVKQLISAFNAMQARVSTLLGEKDVMLGAIGHDLKTPLAALRVRIESVDDDSEREKMAATVDEMVTILDDILTLARLGKSGEALQSVDIGALIESVAGEFDPVEFQFPDRRIVANIRPVLLRRALRNLIGNAILYGKVAKIRVQLGINIVEIIIDDEGSGIDPAEIESMFEPFTRAEKSRSRSTGGSGLGLTISRAIARAHGGDLTLSNREVGGLKATFTFRG